MIEEIFAAIDWRRLAWLSLGVLRTTPGLKRTMRERFPRTQLVDRRAGPLPGWQVTLFPSSAS